VETGGGARNTEVQRKTEREGKKRDSPGDRKVPDPERNLERVFGSKRKDLSGKKK